MTLQAKDILQEARKLPPMERAELVERILETFPFAYYNGEREGLGFEFAAEVVRGGEDCSFSRRLACTLDQVSQGAHGPFSLRYPLPSSS